MPSTPTAKPPVRGARAVGGPLRGHTGELNSVAISPDGTIVATACWRDDFTIRLWNTSGRSQIGEPLAAGQQPARNVALHPNGAVLATAGDDLRLWNVAPAPSVHCSSSPPKRCGLSQSTVTAP